MTKYPVKNTIYNTHNMIHLVGCVYYFLV